MKQWVEWSKDSLEPSAPGVRARYFCLEICITVGLFNFLLSHYVLVLQFLIGRQDLIGFLLFFCVVHIMGEGGVQNDSFGLSRDMCGFLYYICLAGIADMFCRCLISWSLLCVNLDAALVLTVW